MVNERFFPLAITLPPSRRARGGTLAHFLARFLMRFGEMINAAIGEALMDGEREEEEDAAGGRLELFLPMTAFARGAARSALARSLAVGALISALAPRTAMSHFLISDEMGKPQLR